MFSNNLFQWTVYKKAQLKKTSINNSTTSQPHFGGSRGTLNYFNSLITFVIHALETPSFLANAARLPISGLLTIFWYSAANSCLEILFFTFFEYRISNTDFRFWMFLNSEICLSLTWCGINRRSLFIFSQIWLKFTPLRESYRRTLSLKIK